jgi:hypothetical protein
MNVFFSRDRDPGIASLDKIVGHDAPDLLEDLAGIRPVLQVDDSAAVVGCERDIGMDNELVPVHPLTL